MAAHIERFGNQSTTVHLSITHRLRSADAQLQQPLRVFKRAPCLAFAQESVDYSFQYAGLGKIFHSQWLAIVDGVLFAVGTSTVTAIFLAQNRRQEANALFSQNLAVLTAIGLDRAAAKGGLRISLGRENTQADVDAILASVQRAAEKLRAMSPTWSAMRHMGML